MEQMDILEVKNICVSYQGRPTVRNCSFSLSKGEILGIAGESGSGKTTLAMALLGEFGKGAQLTAGNVLLNGKDITPPLREKEKNRLRRNRISVVMQDAMSCLDPGVKVGRLMREVIRNTADFTRKEAQAKAEELLDLVGISDPRQCMERYPFQCSGGMQQRICIAMALSGHPDIMIADEPTTALDVTVQAQILGLLKRISRDLEIPMILISHDLGVVSYLCTRLLIMHEGRIIEQGTPRMLLNHSEMEYTAKLAAAKYRMDRGNENEEKSIREKTSLLLSVNGAEKCFGKSRILKKICMEIRYGQIYGLAGESGSGKTTLAKMLQGIYRPDAGEIKWYGDSSCRKPAQMIFQDPYTSLNPSMTVEENLKEPLFAIYRKEKQNISERVKDAAESVELDKHILNKYPSQLSGGQLQRAVIARALLADPRLLICDEAFSALDAALQVKLAEFLCKLKEKKDLSILFIGHDLSVLRKISDRVGVMYDGMLLEEGEADAIWNNPWHPYTKNLFNAASKTMITARNNNRPIVREEKPAEGSCCPYYKNCIYAGEQCASVCPDMYEYQNRKVRCFLYDPKRSEERNEHYQMTAQI